MEIPARRSPPGTGTPALAAERLFRRFGAHVVLRDLTLGVAWGEAVALVGANGAGKSTFLRIAAGVLSPTRGAVHVGGACMEGRADALRETTALLAGDAFLYNDLTALENLRFAVRMSGGSDDRPRLLGFLETVGLGRVADSRIRHFSSGMRKRLALARVVAMQPGILLLDEPYASLDAEGIDLVDRLVEEMQGEGKTVLLASHQWGRALHLSDRVVVLEGGRIAWTGTPREAESRLPGSGRG